MGERSFFVEPGTIRGEEAEITGAVAHQIGHVLRLRPGDSVELLDNTGAVHFATLSKITRDVVAATIVERRHPDTEPPVRIELFQSLLKGDKMEWVLQKGTELGIARFVPVLSERCVSRPAQRDLAGKLERWRAIVREASEQSGRTRLPEVSPLEGFDQACESARGCDLAVIAWEQEHAASLGGLARRFRAGRATAEGRPSIGLMIGPEGGYSSGEALAAREAGVVTAGLGPRVLRAETAALVAPALVLWEMGGLGG
ncbi:MAG TPA: 16S rRNA (uracil(1498)-N(3))-methyltransferase [Chloroflexota bacterium]